MACSVCTSGKAPEVLAAIKEGVSLRQAAIRFGFSRASTQRHAKFCLKVRFDPSAEARKRRELQAQSFSSDLDTAFQAALEMKRKAIESGDQIAELRAERHVLRLLSLRQKSLNRTVSQVSMEAAQRFDGRRPRVIFDSSAVDPDFHFPERFELDLFAHRRVDAPVLTVRLRLNYQRVPLTEVEQEQAKLQEALELVREFAPGARDVDQVVIIEGDH